MAKVIHYASDRAWKPFMNITCSALPEQLLESELFGHERGRVYFIDGFNTEFSKRVLGATPAAYTLLQRYGWPAMCASSGNVIERAMLLSDGDRLDARDFSGMATALAAGDAFELPATGVDLEKLERSLVIQALRRSGGNQTKAGSLLGLNRDQIRYRIEKVLASRRRRSSSRRAEVIDRSSRSAFPAGRLVLTTEVLMVHVSSTV